MLGIPGEIFWPTAGFISIIAAVFGGVALLRILPNPKSRQLNPADHDALEDLQGRLGQLDQLQDRVGELEERLDFAERLLAKQREGDRALPPGQQP